MDRQTSILAGIRIIALYLIVRTAMELPNAVLRIVSIMRSNHSPLLWSFAAVISFALPLLLGLWLFFRTERLATRVFIDVFFSDVQWTDDSYVDDIEPSETKITDGASEQFAFIEYLPDEPVMAEDIVALCFFAIGVSITITAVIDLLAYYAYNSAAITSSTRDLTGLFNLFVGKLLTGRDIPHPIVSVTQLIIGSILFIRPYKLTRYWERLHHGAAVEPVETLE